jgi:ribose-phosphate pyrophosphokinase
MKNDMRVFSGSNNKDLTERICKHLSIPLGASSTSKFPDGELLVKINEDVRGKQCFVVLSTCSPVNENIMEMLLFCDSLRRASAKQIILVIPYFGYARQDRKDDGRVPITAKLIANMITGAGADRVLVVDLHAAQIQGFFDIPVDHISATSVFLKYFESRRDELGDLCLLSPDVGNIKVAEKFADLLNAELAVIHKQRSSDSHVQAVNMMGDVNGKTVLMFDDMISTAGTVLAASKIAMERGAERCIAAATHGLFVGKAVERLLDPSFSLIITTNTCPQTERIEPLVSADKFEQICVGPLIGEAMKRVFNNESVSALFTRTAGVKR